MLKISSRVENKYTKVKLMHGIKKTWKIKVTKSLKRIYFRISMYENSLLSSVLGYLVKKLGC